MVHHKDLDPYTVHKALFRVLHAYALLDTEVSYCQGMSYVAGYLLKHHMPRNHIDSDDEYSFVDLSGGVIPKEEAGDDFWAITRTRILDDTRDSLRIHRAESDTFWLFAAILHRLEYRRFFLPSLPGVMEFGGVFDVLLTWFLPQLARHFQEHQISVSFMSSWWMTMFTVKDFPLETLHRCWDIFIGSFVVSSIDPFLHDG